MGHPWWEHLLSTLSSARFRYDIQMSAIAFSQAVMVLFSRVVRLFVSLRVSSVFARIFF